MNKNGILKSFKKLTLVTASVAVIALSLGGCTYKAKGLKSFKFVDDSYIVVCENGIETLHKGDVITEQSVFAEISSSTPKLEFDCGTKIHTSQFVSYGEQKPNEGKYDEVCELCFEHE